MARALIGHSLYGMSEARVPVLVVIPIALPDPGVGRDVDHGQHLIAWQEADHLALEASSNSRPPSIAQPSSRLLICSRSGGRLAFTRRAVQRQQHEPDGDHDPRRPDREGDNGIGHLQTEGRVQYTRRHCAIVPTGAKARPSPRRRPCCMGEAEQPVAERAGRREQLLRLFDGHNVGKPLHAGRRDVMSAAG